MINLLYIAAIIVIVWMLNFSLVTSIADAKHIKRQEIVIEALVPIYGVVKILKAQGTAVNEAMLKKTLNHSYLAKTVLKFSVIVFLFTWALTELMSSVVLIKMFAALVVIVMVFVNQSVTHSIADNRGQNTFFAGLMGFIPLVSIAFYLLAPSKRNILEQTVKKQYSVKELLGRAFIYTEITFLAFLVLVPVIYIVGTALTDSSEIPYRLWPKEVSFKNFEILTSQRWLKPGQVEPTKVYFLEWFKNTLMIAVVNMIASVLLITGSAYVFSRFKFKGKKFGLLSIMILQMFPTFLSLVAMYILFDTFGLLNQPMALVMIYTAGAIPFNIWLIKGYLQGIPKDLDESATIDGANKVQIFFKIILPLSLPIITFVAVGQFMAPWLDYILPSYILSGTGANASKGWTIAIGLFRFLEAGNSLYRPTLFAAGALVIAVPITILYISFQKYLIEGMTAGATKG
ncbi:MAG TPA: sugar ABC transporter permease [Acholeplasma sp.]|nr:sugar ABC transporter permease [Acholeplasma sp.]